MRLRLKRIPEKNDKVNNTLGDLCADLLVAAEWTALQFDNREFKGCFQQ